jgi:hypothetical protein
VIPSVTGMTRLEFTHTTKKYRRVTAVDEQN